MPPLLCQELLWEKVHQLLNREVRRLKQKRDELSSPIALPADLQPVIGGCMWKNGVLAPEMAAPLLPTGHMMFSYLLPVQELLIVFGLSTSTHPAALQA